MARRLRAFISFDYDHDSDLRTMLVGQARHVAAFLRAGGEYEPYVGRW